jgi:hypothetical protein
VVFFEAFSFLIIHFVAFFFHFQLDIFYSVLLYGNGMRDFNGVNVKVYEVFSCLFLVYFVICFSKSLCGFLCIFLVFSFCSFSSNFMCFFSLDVHKLNVRF